MSATYLDVIDNIAIAAAVTGLDLHTVLNMTNVDLADSALHAPAAGFGEDDFYPDFIDKAAVLVVRLARNHRRAVERGIVAHVAARRRTQFLPTLFRSQREMAVFGGQSRSTA